MDVSTLATNGFVSLRYPNHVSAHMCSALTNWQKFCTTLTSEEKEKLSTPDRNHDFGYMLREGGTANAEEKELFHVSARDYMDLLERAKTVRGRAGLDFIQAVYSQIEAVKPLVLDFAQAVERNYELKGFVQAVQDCQEDWVFRYSHYPPGASMSAHPHVDRGGFTLHLGETAPGGEYCSHTEKVWHPWPVEDGNTIIFPSMLLQHRSKGRLKALWHRVKPLTIETDRYAMVLFVDFKHSHRYSDRSGRLAEKPLGFNWDMPWSDFNALFEPVV